MKKALFLSLATLTLALTSCEEVIKSISESIVFTFTGSTVYDGQTAALRVPSNSNIGWEVASDSKPYVSLTYSANGQDCEANFMLPDHSKEEVVTLTITTRDLDNSEKEPYVGDIKLAPWRLAAYKKNGKNWDRVGTTLDFSDNGAGTYKAQMECFDGKVWKELSSVAYSLSLKNGVHNILWKTTASASDAKPLGDKTITFSTSTSVEFELSKAPSKSFVICAYLGKDRDEEGNTLDPAKVNTGGMVMQGIAVQP